MRRTQIGFVGVAAIAAGALAMPAGAASGLKHRNVHFTSKVDGASISDTESTLKVHDSIAGNGAGVQKITSLTATGGTDTTIIYYGNAKAFSRDTFTFGPADSNGVIPVTGLGRDVGGTGRFRHLTSTYTFKGTYDPKTTITHVKLTGKESY
jgi:hypothetical protein